MNGVMAIITSCNNSNYFSQQKQDCKDSGAARALQPELNQFSDSLVER